MREPRSQMRRWSQVGSRARFRAFSRRGKGLGLGGAVASRCQRRNRSFSEPRRGVLTECAGQHRLALKERLAFGRRVPTCMPPLLLDCMCEVNHENDR